MCLLNGDMNTTAAMVGGGLNSPVDLVRGILVAWLCCCEADGYDIREAVSHEGGHKEERT